MRNLSVFNKRNIEQNVLVRMYGIHRLFPSRIPFFFQFVLREILLINEKIKFYLFKKLTIPQIEFLVTNRCTLNCKHCAGYIPMLKRIEKNMLSYNEFKIQFDNLIKSVDSIQNFLITGGEPMLVNDIAKICEYVALNKKVINIWIFTNGTIDFDYKMLDVLKRYNKKIIIRLSNYSKNKDLEGKLKHELILGQIKKTQCKYIYKKDMWIPVFKIKKYERTDEGNRLYFRKCLNPCLSVYKGYFFICPRSAAFYDLNLFSFEQQETLNLNNHITKQQIIDYYNNDCFSSCYYCDFIKERSLPLIVPAEQLSSDML